MTEVDAKMIVAVVLLKWMSMKAKYWKIKKPFLMVRLVMALNILFFPSCLCIFFPFEL